MGGLARRVGYAHALNEKLKSEVPIVQLDAGHMFADDVGAKGLTEPARVRNEWVLRAYGQFGFTAANASVRDLPYLGTLMSPAEYTKNAKQYPMLERFVAANVAPHDDTRKAFKPYIIEELSGKRLGNKPLRIAFLGLTEKHVSNGIVGGYAISDPIATAQKYVPELRKKVDLVVVLAYLKRDEAQKLGKTVPGIDAVIVAHQLPYFNTVDEAGDAIVAYVTNQTKWLGEIRLYRSTEGNVSNYIHRDVPLDTYVPDDARALEVVDNAKKAYTDALKSIYRAAGPAVLPAAEATPLATPRDPFALRRVSYAARSPFAGSTSCATCHEEEYKVWEGSAHARAFQTLVEKNEETNARCTPCHVVGQGFPGGYSGLTLTPQFVNVQCESCHSAGKSHNESPKLPYPHMSVPNMCVQCHTPEHSPEFDFEAYWAKIAHGKRDM